jgi:hypothetical protein
MGEPEYCDLQKREYKDFTGMLGFGMLLCFAMHLDSLHLQTPRKRSVCPSA